MATRVVHCKREPYDVYIGRPSKWGNPFKLAGEDDDVARADVIADYRVYLLADPEMVAEAKRELRGKTLGCWCKPKPCHGDVLAEVADAD